MWRFFDYLFLNRDCQTDCFQEYNMFQDAHRADLMQKIWVIFLEILLKQMAWDVPKSETKKSPFTFICVSLASRRNHCIYLWLKYFKDRYITYIYDSNTATQKCSFTKSWVNKHLKINLNTLYKMRLTPPRSYKSANKTKMDTTTLFMRLPISFSQ